MCIGLGVSGIGKLAELRERVAAAQTMPEPCLNNMADEVAGLLRDIHPGHSSISMFYRTRFNMVDQFDRDFYSQGPQHFRGTVTGKWLLDLLFIAKLNAYARFQLDSDDSDPT